jgi:hypothetical protein
MKPLLSTVVTNLMVTTWLGPYKRFKVLLYSLARTLIMPYNLRVKVLGLSEGLKVGCFTLRKV